MAHKPNNTTRDIGDQQFDLMLRRHLQRSGATVAPCEGFDAEKASAYVERSLLTAAHQAYETHLASCVGCRRHVTALLRLQADLAPQQPAIAPAHLPVAVPVWMRWMAQANAWWSELNFGWGLAGAGALATVLIAAVTFNGWQNQAVGSRVNAPMAEGKSLEANSGIVAGNNDSLAPTAELPAAPTVLSESTNGSALLVAATTNANAAAARGAENSNFNAPSLPNLGAAKPQLIGNNYPYSVTPAASMRVVEIPDEVIALNPASMVAPTISLPASREFFGNGFTNNGEVRGTAVSVGAASSVMPMHMRSIQSPTTVSSLNVVKDQLERQSDAAGLVRTGGRTAADKDAEDKNSKLAKADASRARAILNTLLGQGAAMSFAPNKVDDSRTKEAEKSTDPTAIKPMTKRVNGHTFYYERSFWIDEDYRSDTTLPLVKLTRGSERYQNILIENPTLETFFQLGQVIVVWKGKVYEVRK